MKRILFLLSLIYLGTACTRVVVVERAPRHDNGLHKGWYKHKPNYGKGPKHIPPGQSKKMGYSGKHKQKGR